MKKMFVVFAAFVLACTINTNAQNLKKNNVQDYIERYRALAMSEQQRTGIPAAIKLAQGIHETGAGTSKLATEANNHFGLKCKTGWTGQTYNHTDDRANECFRKYNLDFESYQDQSNYLKSNPRYASLFSLSVTDYAAWAFGLHKAGYATNPKYPQLLIKIIEDYRLQEYTYAALGSNGPATGNIAAAPVYDDTRGRRDNNNSYGQQYNQPAQQQQPAYNNYNAQNSYGNNNGGTQAYTPPTNNYGGTQQIDNTPPERISKYIDTRPNERQTVVRSRQNGRTVEQRVDNAPQTVVKINNLRAVYGKAGDMPLQYAVRNGVRYEKFLEMNDLEEKPLPTDMPLYLERKHFWGIRPMHLVKPGETMLVIAQKEGVQLKYLRDLNYMEPGEEPMPGVTLELQAQAGTKPATRPHTAEDDGNFVRNNQDNAYNNNSYANNENYDGYGEDPEIVNNPRYYDPAAAEQAPPTRTFPKNPAPVVQEEKTIFEKIKEAREIRKKEKEIQAAIAQQQQPAITNSPGTAQQPAATQATTSKYLETPAAQPAYTQPANNGSDTRGNFKPNPAAQVYNNNTPPKIQHKQPARQETAISDNTYQQQQPTYQQPQQQQNTYQQQPAYQPQQPAYQQSQQNANQYTAGNNVKPNPAAQVQDEEPSKRERKRGRKNNDDDNAAQPAVATPQPQKPRTELDALKEQFDNVIYAGNDNQQQKYQQPQQRQQPPQQNYQQQSAQNQQPAYNQQQSYQQQPAQQNYPQPQQGYAQQPQYNQQSYEQQQQGYSQQSYQQNSYGQQPQQAAQQPVEPGKFYTVKRGDTAYTIAKKNGITIRQLMDWNGLDFDAIKEGQQLRVKP